MQFLLEKIKDSLTQQLINISISNPRKASEIKKYTVRPILVKEKLCFQLAAYSKTQVFHENLLPNEIMNCLPEILSEYKQVQIQTASGDTTALINKKGKAAIKVLKNSKPSLKGQDPTRLLHNRTKRYILQEGKPVPFLQDLGVMTEEGKIVRSRYDKFRQINRFLEFIEDILPHLSGDRELTILDFGCGKSYLTFAMYYYLKKLKGYAIRIIGLDLKKDVIKNCSRLAKKYGYDKLQFLEGSIEEFEGVSHVDMVVTLHACDTATDYAMYKAVQWGADVILSVPCCQHELNGQITNDEFAPVMDYGILKERFSAMATDGIRAKILTAKGYETQILEFIDMEHTPKNLLIRAVKNHHPKKKIEQDAQSEVQDFCQMFGFEPTLQRLFEEGRGSDE